jgi:hypothetical protein
LQQKLNKCIDGEQDEIDEGKVKEEETLENQLYQRIDIHYKKFLDQMTDEIVSFFNL